MPAIAPAGGPDLRALIPRKTRSLNAGLLFRGGAYRATPRQQERPGDLLRLLLPVPPSINHHYATVNGRRVLSAAGRRFKALVGQEVLCALSKQAGGRGLLAGQSDAPLALDLRFYFVSELRRDIDGGLKITQDAVCEALGINDNRIVEVTLRKDRDAAAPRMELALRAAGPAL
ncbi:MAG: RusA family crossover junction endodeoxyribonuclease [Nitrospirae bacterium]|nr:MAG: RusA family crossover junction endodeoxyribonuclease [Nitrospirota bacterium]